MLTLPVSCVSWLVAENQELIDKTLLFNVKLIRVDKPGQNGWKTGKA